MEDKPTIVIGIDFGTTFSGVAWARSGKPDQSHIITNWKSQSYGNTDKSKAPTAISYDRGQDLLSWGYDIPAGETPVRWFKLLLVDEQDIPHKIRYCSHLRNARNLVKQLNKHPVEVIGDYLGLLWKHSLENIEKAAGKSLVDISSFRVIVTLPAIWPTYAQRRMREAIELAGILDDRPAGQTTCGFVSEPEAAALATMEDLLDRPDIKRNDQFVICDAGGGTVDIITYQVSKIKPMTVRESIKGDGKLCGAVFLDEGFYFLLRKLIPPDMWNSLGPSGIKRILNDDWEHGIKPDFYSIERQWSINVPFGGSLKNHFHPPEVVVTGRQVAKVFKPIVTDIAELVCSQMDAVMKSFKKPPKYIILVGGFGKSRHLYQSLQELVERKYKATDILQSAGERPWSAVCRGAVIRGLAQRNLTQLIIDSRVARASYGTIMNVVPWDAASHIERDKSWCSIQRDFLALDQVEWFVRVGDTIHADEPVKHSFWQDFEVPDNEISTELVYCEESNPPNRCESSVKHLCKIVWSKIPDFDDMPTWTNGQGRKIRHLCYEVCMTTDGASLDFQIMYEGNIMASKNVAVDFSDTGATSRPNLDDW